MRVGNLEPFLTLEVRNDLIGHMRDEGEHECCGLITLSRGKYKYVRKENKHPQPREFFAFDKQTKLDIAKKKSIVAFAHSHPRGPTVPSKKDMEVQISSGKPSVIVYYDPGSGVVDLFSFGDHLLEAPLEGRQFRYNQFDCIFAFRSWVWQNEGRYMPPPPPSEDNWWLIGAHNAEDLPDNPDLYLKNFQRYGYNEFEPDFDNPSSPWHPQVGDGLLMQLGAPVLNHIGVYIGNNQVYHHRANKLSCPQAVGYLLPYIRKWVRHESKL